MSSKSRILVTGATGFVGGHCVSALGERFDVVASGRNPAKLASLRSSAVVEQLELTSPDADRRLAEHAPDVIVHSAALSSPWGRRDKFWAANVDATDAVLRACDLANARLVYLSTPTIYMDGANRLMIGEDAALPDSFINAYSTSKFTAEKHIRRSDIDAVILRPQAIVGMGDTSIAPRFLRVADRGFMPVIRGNDPWLDMTHVGNVVGAIERSCDHLIAGASTGCQTVNITIGDPRRLSDLLRLFLDARSVATNRRPVRMVPIPKAALAAVARIAETAGHVMRREPPVTRYTVELLSTSRTLDIAKARSLLDYDPTPYTIEQAFTEYFESTQS